MIFQDRIAAARLLAEALQAWRGAHPVVYAIPRGAVPMAQVIAEALGGDFDVVLTRKLGAPGNPELAIGAIGESGWMMLDAMAETVPREYIDEEVVRESRIIAERRALYTPAHPPVDPAARVVIVVDDGLATGSTMIAALHDLRQKRPSRLICAVPVASPEAAAKVAKLVDEFVCLHTPYGFQGVGQFYRDFSQVTDAEVMSILRADPPDSPACGPAPAGTAVRQDSPDRSAAGAGPADARLPVGITPAIAAFLDRERPATPCLTVDLDAVTEHLTRMRRSMPRFRILYAVKANPLPDVIGCCARLATDFDLASTGEIGRCLQLGIAPERLSFGNTIKKEADIAWAFARGIRLFAFDSPAELEKLARSAPGSRVFCRILAEGEGAEWPLSRKFGCGLEMAIDLLHRARTLGLAPSGVSFHVGSQQVNPHAWDPAIKRAAHVFAALAQRNVDLAFLNIGGGFPGHYRTPVPPIEDYAGAIDESLTRHFGASRPEVLVEPGRHLVADAGFLQAEVVLVAQKSRGAARRWVFLDAGRYNGLPETANEAIKFRLWVRDPDRRSGLVSLAGPTCDSSDVMYRTTPYELPLDLEIGEKIGFLSAGAYTASYASVEFNGFRPIETHVVGGPAFAPASAPPA